MLGLLLTRVIPPTATIAPLYDIAIRLHLTDSYLGMILILSALEIPLGVSYANSVERRLTSDLQHDAFAMAIQSQQPLDPAGDGGPEEVARRRAEFDQGKAQARSVREEVGVRRSDAEDEIA